MDRVEKTNAMRLLDRLGIAYTPLSYPMGRRRWTRRPSRPCWKPRERIFRPWCWAATPSTSGVCPGPT